VSILFFELICHQVFSYLFTFECCAGPDLGTLVVDEEVSRDLRLVLQVGQLQAVGAADLLWLKRCVQMFDGDHGLGALGLLKGAVADHRGVECHDMKATMTDRIPVICHWIFLSEGPLGCVSDRHLDSVHQCWN